MIWKWSDLKKLLRREATVDELAAVMWPVVPWDQRVENTEPHCTVLMLGDIRDVNFTKGEVITAIQQTYHTVFLWARVEELEYFGPDKDVPVLRIYHPYLPVFRESLQKVLKMRGIKWDERYPTYRPHVTIPQEIADDKAWPDSVMLSPIELWWGKERITIPNPDQIVSVGRVE